MIDLLQAKPLFSIVIPVRNRHDLVAGAVASILEQTFQNFEIIIVDDGSDKPISMPEAVSNDERVHLLRQPPLGANAARNRGIEQSSGKFIAFLDVDDRFLPEKLETVASFVEDGAMWLSHFAMVKRAEGIFATRPRRAPLHNESVGEYILKNGQFLQTSTLIVSRDIAECVKFDENLKKFQDVDFAIRLSKILPYPVFIPRVLSVWSDVRDNVRISQNIYPDAAIAFHEKLKNLVSKSEVDAYAATMLGYEISGKRPLKASTFVVSGLASRSINPKTALRQMARIWMTQSAYRKMVNCYLRVASSIR